MQSTDCAPLQHTQMPIESVGQHVLTVTSNLAKQVATRAAVTMSGGDDAPSPHTELLSVAALGDAVALLVAARLFDANLLATAALVGSWAATAPLVGAYADARTIGEAARAPVAAIAVSATCGRGVALLEGDLSPQSWLLALLATGALVEGWRLAIFAIGRTDRALNAFARAVVDEDGGDDDTPRAVNVCVCACRSQTKIV